MARFELRPDTLPSPAWRASARSTTDGVPYLIRVSEDLAMAVDMFIKIDGIKGEARDSSHKDDIDVLAWSWGASNSGSAHVGGGQGAGKVNVQDLSFTKWLDKASPDLLLHCCNGKHISKAELFVRKAGNTPLEYLHITMDELIVTSVSTGGSGCSRSRAAGSSARSARRGCCAT